MKYPLVRNKTILSNFFELRTQLFLNFQFVAESMSKLCDLLTYWEVFDFWGAGVFFPGTSESLWQCQVLNSVPASLYGFYVLSLCSYSVEQITCLET